MITLGNEQDEPQEQSFEQTIEMPIEKGAENSHVNSVVLELSDIGIDNSNMPPKIPDETDAVISIEDDMEEPFLREISLGINVDDEPTSEFLIDKLDIQGISDIADESFDETHEEDSNEFLMNTLAIENMQDILDFTETIDDTSTLNIDEFKDIVETAEETGSENGDKMGEDTTETLDMGDMQDILDVAETTDDTSTLNIDEFKDIVETAEETGNENGGEIGDTSTLNIDEFKDIVETEEETGSEIGSENGDKMGGNTTEMLDMGDMQDILDFTDENTDLIDDEFFDEFSRELSNDMDDDITDDTDADIIVDKIDDEFSGDVENINDDVDALPHEIANETNSKITSKKTDNKPKNKPISNLDDDDIKAIVSNVMDVGTPENISIYTLDQVLDADTSALDTRAPSLEQRDNLDALEDDSKENDAEEYDIEIDEYEEEETEKIDFLTQYTTAKDKGENLIDVLEKTKPKINASKLYKNEKPKTEEILPEEDTDSDTIEAYDNQLESPLDSVFTETGEDEMTITEYDIQSETPDGSDKPYAEEVIQSYAVNTNIFDDSNEITKIITEDEIDDGTLSIFDNNSFLNTAPLEENRHKNTYKKDVDAVKNATEYEDKYKVINIPNIDIADLIDNEVREEIQTELEMFSNQFNDEGLSESMFDDDDAIDLNIGALDETSVLVDEDVLNNIFDDSTQEYTISDIDSIEANEGIVIEKIVDDTLKPITRKPITRKPVTQKPVTRKPVTQEKKHSVGIESYRKDALYGQASYISEESPLEERLLRKYTTDSIFDYDGAYNTPVVVPAQSPLSRPLIQKQRSIIDSLVYDVVATKPLIDASIDSLYTKYVKINNALSLIEIKMKQLALQTKTSRSIIETLIHNFRR